MSDVDGTDLDGVVDDAVALVERWLAEADRIATPTERRTTRRLHGVVVDPDGVEFTMRFVDRVIRPDDDRVAAAQLASLVRDRELPGFLGPVDRLALRAGARLAPLLPRIVMPLARRRMRALVGHLVVDAGTDEMAEHFATRRSQGFDLNVNLLGEAVLGGREAERRFREAMQLLDQPDVDYVSVKVSAIVPQLNPWDHDGSVARVLETLRPLLRRAATTTPPTFVNLDMEEYHDLDLTLDAFTTLLDEPELHGLDAGIVLQAYLPDSFPALQRLVGWANERFRREVDGKRGGTVKVRLVKGANLAMERVDAEIHGWEQAPYRSKAETDANYKRCLDWLLRPDRLDGVRVGVGSHNLFDCAFAHLVAERRGVADSVTIEMLEGMAQAHARVARDDTGGLLLYTPAVDPADFDVAISYLFRRLEENTSDDNFIRHLFDLTPGGDRFAVEAERFRTAVEERWTVGAGPQRSQQRPARRPDAPDLGPFENEPDTDPVLPSNRAWIGEVLSRPFSGPEAAIETDRAAIDRLVARARSAADDWRARDAAERREVLRAVGDELGYRRGDLIAAMVHEGRKTVAQSDPEVSEAIDFARYYADRAVELPSDWFTPLGVVAVVPPWNFPVAIPAGGVLAALAAGNGAILKPAPETPRCAEIVAECCWTAGVPTDLLAYVRTNDDEVGRRLVAHDGVDAVILTGASDTARLFGSWRPERPVFAETSGKNALVITPSADIDLAVADLVSSAFGHSGQKCSAASLAIVIGEVGESDRFRRQLVDAVTSLHVGDPSDLGTDMGPTITEPSGKLERALTDLDPGEEWLVEPRRTESGIWSPGVRTGVRPGSWFHRTECFGPVLGVIRVDDLDEAIAVQNGTGYGLTGGIHSLDPSEIRRWLDRVEVGNAYVNRVTTGAIVRRQPFGGWKASSVGPGAKAGGPNYVAQLGTWTDGAEVTDRRVDPTGWLAVAEASDAAAWADEFGREHDRSGLASEANVFRYRPLPSIVVRVEADALPVEVDRIRATARRAAVPVAWSRHDDESQADLAARLGDPDVHRVRLLGAVGDELRAAAIEHGVHLADDLVLADGRREMLHFLREQAISRTMHRYGNILRPRN